MENILQQINALTEELQALQPIDPEFQRKLDKKFRLEFNYNSNHLEGNTLTYGETELLLIFDNTKGNHTMREYEEMQAHDVALRLVQEWAHDHERPLSEADIKELNKIILVRPYWKDAITPDGQQTRRQILVGEYKKHPNSVRLANGELFDYASPTDTPIKMGELIQWFRAACEKGEMHPVELAARLHHQFVLIHPFDDGNGRISRLLMNYVFWRFGYPPIIIKSKDKLAYLQALNRADVGEMDFFVEYVGKQVLWSLELSVKAAKGESVEDADDVDKELELLRRELASKDSEIGITANYRSVAEIIEHDLIHMFHMIEDKLAIINPFFNSWSKSLSFILEGGQVKKLETKEKKWDILFARFASTILMSQKIMVTSIEYFYGLWGLNTSIERQRFEIVFQISFHYKYFEIETNMDNFKFKYGEVMQKADMEKIVASLIQPIIEQIRTGSLK